MAHDEKKTHLHLYPDEITGSIIGTTICRITDNATCRTSIIFTLHCNAGG